MEKKEGLRWNSRGYFAGKERLTKSSRRKVVGNKRMRWGGGDGKEGKSSAGGRRGGKERLSRDRKDLGGR